MKRLNRVRVLLTMLLFSGIVSAQLQSKYLQNPNSAIEVITNEADFWANYQDNVNGGFYNEVDKYGNYSTVAQKSFASNSRLAYAFVRAFMVTGDMEYLNKARHAMNFLYDFAWDDVNGGWYYAANADGSNPQHNMYHNGKWSYIQHYAMLGNVAMNEATDGSIVWNDGRASDKAWMNTGLNMVYSKLWDNTVGIEGFYDIANHDWSNPHDKGFTPTADGLTTHATVMALRNIDDYYKNSFFTLADRVAYNVIPTSYTSSSPLIYEYADSQWQPFGQELFNGHAIKCAWNLSRAYLMNPAKSIYKEKTEQVLDEMLARNYYDNTYGGVHYFKTSGQKSHWTQEQAILAGILASHITDDPIKQENYLNLADGSWKFMEDHMLDFTNGGSFTDVEPNGSVGNYGKGDYWEAGYHTTETAYYTYLYGNIYLYNQPVDLYYYFEETGVTQVQKLTPLAVEESALVIDKVTLDGVEFTAFNAETRELNIAGNQGGLFKVTFKPNTDIVPCPLVSLGQDQSICGNTNIVLDPSIEADGELTFTWYKDNILVQGPDLVSNTYSATSSGVYRVEVTKEGCSRSDEINISGETPVFALGNDQVYGSPTVISTGLSATNPHTWYKNDVAISGEASASITVTEPGAYRADVDFGACGISSDEIVFLDALSITYASSAVTIDGTKDATYDQTFNVEKTILSASSTDDLSATFSTVWDETNLYVFVAVTDDDLRNDSGNTWYFDDGVEIYVDGDNSKGTSYDHQNDFQWGFVYNASTIYAGGNNPSNSTVGITHVITQTANGYNCEVAIPWTTIGVNPVAGNNIGLEIGVNDDDNGSGRDSKIMWESSIDDSWQNPSLFASIGLQAGEQNALPIANAGTNFTMDLPFTSFDLAGSATDGDGVLTYSWSTASSATITNANSLTPTISGITSAGTYTFDLTVTDEDGDTDTDAVTVTVNPVPIAVTGITIDQANQTLEQGQTVQLSATVLPANADNKNFTWASNNQTVATVDNNGLVSALALGTTTVSATTDDGGFISSITITVTEADILPIANAGTDFSMDLPFTSFNLSGSVTSGNGTLTYNWTTVSSATVSNPNSLTPTISGITSAGTYTFDLTVTDEDGDTDTDAVTVTVNPAPIAVTGITIDQANQTVEQGQTVQLSATVLPVDAENKNFTWASNNQTVATVDNNGLVSALALGSTTVSATTEDGGFASLITVTVTEADILPVANAGTDFTMGLPFTSFDLAGSASEGNGTLTYNWTTASSATITNANSLTPTILGIISEGSYVFELSVTDADGDTDSDNVTVTVNPAPIVATGITIDQTDQTIEEGETVQLSATVLPVDAENKNYTWASNDVSIATVDANGLVSGVGVGITTITATTEDGGYVASVSVEVLEGSSVCTSYPIPSASDWVIQNDWNDGTQAATGFTNNSEALVFTQRAWGYDEAYLIQTGQGMAIESGKTYTLSLDILDDDSRISSVKVGMCTGTTWNGPTGVIVPMTEVASGYSSSSYTSKQVSVTATGSSSNAYFVVYIDITNTQQINQDYLIKNINVCEGASSLKGYYYADVTEEVKEQEVEATIESTVSLDVFPNPAVDLVTISLEGTDVSEGKTITIANTVGQIVLETITYTESVELNVSDLAFGVYYISIDGQQEILIIE